ncbi:MAG: 4-hydroxy-tetrahydrodipicolinate reductase [Verrucomicrobiota bacterium]|jgi:4-hydroxy-tetrahydrodipicolinate reductase
MSAPVRVMLIGSAGRMGQAIIEVSQHDSNIEIVSQCDCGDSLAAGFKDCQVAIDFSTPDTSEEICRLASQHRRALVIGTTGHSAAQKRLIEAAAVSVPVVFASNFSVGVNALFWLTGKAAQVLGPEFEVQIVETHHQMKKDAPSGTAKTLAEILKKVRPDDAEIPIQSIREGEVVGEHTVSFSGPGERLELVHHAHSRATFAKGALLAAKWVVDKPPSLYTMQNVLGL